MAQLHVTMMGPTNTRQKLATNFVGTNSSLVAPLNIGNNSYIGAGSVITKDVEDDALAVARGKQSNKSGWAKNKSKSCVES